MERPRFSANQVRTRRCLIPGRIFILHLLEYDGSVSNSLIKVISFIEYVHLNESQLMVKVIKTDSKTISSIKTLHIKLSDVSVFQKNDGTWETHSWLSRP
jgi:hypothetical protein